MNRALHDVDAVVVGAGHNGLVAANLLAQAGWEVVVLEQQDIAGGAIRSDNSLHPDYVTDWFSSFYPLTAASPVMRALDLTDWGVEWRHAPDVLAHVWPDGRVAVMSRDRHRTAASLDEFAAISGAPAGDGKRWLELVAQYDRIAEPLLQALMTPFPPVRGGLRLARALGTAEALRFARFAVTPVRRFGDERFDSEAAPVLLAGNALHSDLPPEAAGSAVYGWLLCMLGQSVGFPVPAGGSGAIAAALVARLTSLGGAVRTGVAVERIDVAGGRVQAVRTSGGERIRTPVVLADTGAPQLFTELLDPAVLPPRMLRDLSSFQWDSPTLKVDWALSERIPWRNPEASTAGTVHLGVDLDGLTHYAASLATRRMPEHPFLLLGQTTTADPSRSPAGTESVWAYTHVPEGLDLTADDVLAHVARMESAIELQAPGFCASVVARRVQAPGDLQAADANLVGGAVAGGTAGLHQQLVFRPVPGLGRAETPVDGLYLASAGAHPGGGVHGGPGSNAARAALARARVGGQVRRRMLDAAFRRIYAG